MPTDPRDATIVEAMAAVLWEADRHDTEPHWWQSTDESERDVCRESARGVLNRMGNLNGADFGELPSGFAMAWAVYRAIESKPATADREAMAIVEYVASAFDGFCVTGPLAAVIDRARALVARARERGMATAAPMSSQTPAEAIARALATLDQVSATMWSAHPGPLGAVKNKTAADDIDSARELLQQWAPCPMAGEAGR